MFSPKSMSNLGRLTVCNVIMPYARVLLKVG
jgi:hypothetical protein